VGRPALARQLKVRVLPRDGLHGLPLGTGETSSIAAPKKNPRPVFRYEPGKTTLVPACDSLAPGERHLRCLGAWPPPRTIFTDQRIAPLRRGCGPGTDVPARNHRVSRLGVERPQTPGEILETVPPAHPNACPAGRRTRETPGRSSARRLGASRSRPAPTSNDHPAIRSASAPRPKPANAQITRSTAAWFG